jgi:IS605 OrfB family transposase
VSRQTTAYPTCRHRSALPSTRTNDQGKPRKSSLLEFLHAPLQFGHLRPRRRFAGLRRVPEPSLLGVLHPRPHRFRDQIEVPRHLCVRLAAIENGLHYLGPQLRAVLPRHSCSSWIVGHLTWGDVQELPSTSLAGVSPAVLRRQGPDRRTGQQPSNRWCKANARRNRVHHRVANLRRDTVHKLTTGLAREYGTVVVEDLNVAGMVRNRRLARHIADAEFGEIRRQLAYKTTWNGGDLHVADRWFPSSKTCSACQAAKLKLPLRVRTFTCEHCGLVLDRDESAALNLAALVKRHVAQSGWETVNGRGADRKTGHRPAGGVEASTPHQTAVRVRRGPSPGNGRITETH